MDFGGAHMAGEGFLGKYVTASLTHCALTLLLLFFFFFFLLMCFLNQISSGFFFSFLSTCFLNQTVGFGFIFWKK